MQGLIITASILLFFAALLFSSVVLSFAYKNGVLTTKVRYLFIIVDFSPKKLAKRAEKKAARGVKKEYKKQKAEEETKQKEKKATVDTVKTVWSMLKACKKGINIIRNHLVFYKIRVNIIAGGEDAHKISKNYAAFCMLIPNSLSLLDALFVVREPRVFIHPDFLLEKTSMDIAFKMRIRPWFVLSAALATAVRIVKVMRSNKQKRQKVKGGKRHEPTASYQ